MGPGWYSTKQWYSSVAPQMSAVLLASSQALSAEIIKCSGGGESLVTTAYFLLGQIQKNLWAPGDVFLLRYNMPL